MGRHGFGKGSNGVACSLSGGGGGEARHHRECDQPGLDRDGTPRDTGGRWECSVASLLGKGPMDYRTSDLCRRWRILDEPGSADRNTNRIEITRYLRRTCLRPLLLKVATGSSQCAKNL